MKAVSLHNISKFPFNAKAALVILLVLSGVWNACKPDLGTPLPLQPPTTQLFVNEINLDEDNFLLTRVRLFWSGFDATGFIIGYRVSWALDSISARNGLATSRLVQRTDSLFLFNFQVSGGSQTGLVYFFVQAVNNAGLEDPNPAFLKIPVRNSPPVAKFDPTSLPDTNVYFSTISLGWQVTDPDGFDNIDSVFLKVNNGAWVPINKNINYVTLVAPNPKQTGVQEALVYAGVGLAREINIPQPLARRLPGYVVGNGGFGNGNRFYIKVKDQAGSVALDSAASVIIDNGLPTTVHNFVCLPQVHDLLLIDAHTEAFADLQYQQALEALAISYDKLDLLSNRGKMRPKNWNAGFYILLSLYKKTLWYSDFNVTNVSELLLLDFATAAFQQYIKGEGAALITAKFPDQPNNRLPREAPVFDLLPVDSLPHRANITRLRGGSKAKPLVAGYDTLIVSGQITGFAGFFPSADAEELYRVASTDYIVTNPLLGFNPPLTIAARRKNDVTGKPNLTFFACELHRLRGTTPEHAQSFRNVIQKILNDFD
jgi:hypothetical protein